MPGYQFALTKRLEIGYLEWNPQGPATAVLVHGWPDAPQCWNAVAPFLVQAGYRVLAPALRGYAPTRFLDAATPRSGQLSALGRDLLEFIDALGLRQPLLVGHDWGARAVANACGLRPGVASHMVLLSVGYASNDPHQVLPLSQARSYWYQWFMATPQGQRAIQEQGEDFARRMWDTWSPPGWYREADFQQALPAFQGPDWAAVVVHSYRHRWGLATGDADYAEDEARLYPAPILSVPALMLHGAADSCSQPASSQGKEGFFKGRYVRQVLDGVGHFPQREAPQVVVRAIVDFCNV